MSTLHHDNDGKFTLKGSEHRKLRNIRLTDTCWSGLQERANNRGISRPDLIEEFAAYPDSSQELAALRREVEELKAQKKALNREIEEVQGRLTQALDSKADCARQKKELEKELNRLTAVKTDATLTIATGEDEASTGINACVNSNDFSEKLRSLLSESLKLPANKGGAIKLKIKEALALL